MATLLVAAASVASSHAILWFYFAWGRSCEFVCGDSASWQFPLQATMEATEVKDEATTGDTDVLDR